MTPQEMLLVFDRETQCEYKDRQYLVRDNGSVLRLPKEGSRPSKWDNVWTFGTKNTVTGYMILTGNIRVHQIVCTAFHGPAPAPNMVVDHIDTNRCNNRPENLRWVTRLENVILNPATRKKIIYHCGSVEAFLDNPAMMQGMDLTPDISWMKTVTKEEAAACKKHMEEWAEIASKQKTETKPIGDWVFSDDEMSEAAEWNKGRSYTGFYPERQERVDQEQIEHQIEEEKFGLKDSLTPGAKQLNWSTPTEFLQCPKEGEERTLQAYLRKLVKGKKFGENLYGSCGTIKDAGYNPDDDAVYVLTYGSNPVAPWALCKITLEDDYFVHESVSTYLSDIGGKKSFTLAMGKQWDGPDCIDDYC